MDGASLPAKRQTGAPPGNRNAARLNPKVKQVVALLLTEPELSVVEACERVQCHRNTFYKAERSEAYQAHLATLSRTRLRTRIAAKAIHRYERLLDAESEYVAADIAKDALAQVGVRETLDRGQRPAATGGVSISFVSVQAQNAQINVAAAPQSSAPDEKGEPDE
jgi:transposase-like protein